MRRKSSSIFKEFTNAYADVQGKRHKLGVTRKTLLEELNVYFNSYAWASTEKEKTLFLISMREKTFKERAQLLQMSESAYNTMSSRMTAQLNKLLFDGMSLEEVVYNTDDTVVIKALRKAFYLNRVGNAGYTYSQEVKNYLERYSTPNIDITEPDESEMLKAVYLLALYSVDIFTFILNRVDTDTLGYILDKIESDGPSDELFYYQLAKQRIKEQSAENTLEFIEALSAYAKSHPAIFS